MECFYCGNPAPVRCLRCRRAICPDHGEGLCVRCEDPAYAVPSPRLFRGVMLTSLVAVLLGLWIVLKSSGASEPTSPPVASPQPSVAAALPSAAPSPGPPSPQPFLTASPGPSPSISASPRPSPTPALARRYIVGPGDNPSAIAEKCGVTTADIVGLNPDLNPTRMQIGQELLIPIESRC